MSAACSIMYEATCFKRKILSTACMISKNTSICLSLVLRNHHSCECAHSGAQEMVTCMDIYIYIYIYIYPQFIIVVKTQLVPLLHHHHLLLRLVFDRHGHYHHPRGLTCASTSSSSSSSSLSSSSSSSSTASLSHFPRTTTCTSSYSTLFNKYEAHKR